MNEVKEEIKTVKYGRIISLIFNVIIVIKDLAITSI